jgi:hypothetical protein
MEMNVYGRKWFLNSQIKVFCNKHKILTIDYIPKAYIYSEIFIVCSVKMYI